MILSNPLIAHSTLVTIRASELGCTVQAVLGNVVLCCRKADDTYITWRARIVSPWVVGNDYQVEFISGCYDMDIHDGHANLIERFND